MVQTIQSSVGNCKIIHNIKQKIIILGTMIIIIVINAFAFINDIMHN